MKLTVRIWRQANADGQRRGDGGLPGRRRQRRHVVPGDARHAQRGPDPARRGPGGLRPRLPRGHLRNVRRGHQRPGRTDPSRPRPASFTCGSFNDGDVIDVEPWRAKAFPVHQGPGRRPHRLRPDHPGSGGYITAPTGAAPEAHSTPVPKADADAAFENATCIGCGACVAACPNGSAMLFTSAKVTHLNLLPQGQPERESRVLSMVTAMDDQDFGGMHEQRRVRGLLPEGHPVSRASSTSNREFLRASRSRGK